MTSNDAIECIEELSNLFPNADLQDAELKLFRDTLGKFDRNDAIDAIRTHRLKCEFNRPKFNQILADLYGRERSRPSSSGAAKPSHRYVDVLRRDLIAKGRPARDWSDAEVAMRVGLGWAMKYTSAGNAARIRHDVTEMLTRECGVARDIAVACAESCFLSPSDFEDSMDRLGSGRAA